MLHAIQLAEGLKRRLFIIYELGGRRVSALTATTATASSARSASTGISSRLPAALTTALPLSWRLGRLLRRPRPYGLHNDVRSVLVQRTFRRVHVDRPGGRGVI